MLRFRRIASILSWWFDVVDYPIFPAPLVPVRCDPNVLCKFEIKSGLARFPNNAFYGMCSNWTRITADPLALVGTPNGQTILPPAPGLLQGLSREGGGICRSTAAWGSVFQRQLLQLLSRRAEAAELIDRGAHR